jgi:RNA polymerase sigma-70 factor (ECF subfamily)
MPALPQTRQSLLLRLRSRADDDAWTEFLALYGPAVFGYFRRRGLQEADAVDLTQEVFRAVSGAITRFEYQPARGRFRSWLFTIVSREFLKFRRRCDRLPLAAEPGALDQYPREEPDAEAIWEESVRRQLFERALEEVRTQVSEATFRAFTLTAVDGLPGEEAAGRLGMSRAAVYLARGRVLARLRTIIASIEESEGGS